MCGINGILYSEANERLVDHLQMMNQSIIHRGPDDDGVYSHMNKVGMAMRRLAIIDLVAGKQPMTNADQSIVITFNGEIYNFKQLKDELLEKGVSFATHSDTEVVLKMYEMYGVASFSMLNGMFAVAIHDLKKNKLIIARDRFGEKPLYYHASSHEFIWASELKSIVKIRPELKHISTKALHCYFALTYIPAPLTIYEGVKKLRSGYYLDIDTQTLQVKEHQYWDLPRSAGQVESPIQTYEEAQMKVHELLFESVQQRMISDVPLGVFLSGGIDSSIIASVMAQQTENKVKTFTIGFENKRYDESERSQMVAQHIQSEHHRFVLSYNDIIDSIDDILLNFDEPFADSSSLPTYFVSYHARKEVKVALTGDGGDEVFGGYNKYLVHTYGNAYQKIMPKVVHNGFKQLATYPPFSTADTRSSFFMAKKFLNAIGDGVVDTHLNIIALANNQSDLNILLGANEALDYKQVIQDNIDIPINSDLSPLKVARYLDKQISLEGDMLVKVDRVSMLTSLECRAPFLDHRLMELSYRMPDSFLLLGNNKKRILKDTFAYLLPNGFFDAPKKGFEVPIGYWLRNELKDSLKETLSIGNLNQHGLLNVSYVQQLIADHLSGKRDHTMKLWTLYTFQKWYNYQSQA